MGHGKDRNERTSEQSELLRFNQERYEALVEHAYDSFIMIDHTGKIIDWNRQACITFGWSKQEAQGQLISDLIIPERFRERHKQGMSRFLATGQGPVLNKVIEVPAIHKDGHEIPVEMTITPLEF